VFATYRIAPRLPPEIPDEADVYETLLRTKAAFTRRASALLCGVAMMTAAIALAEARSNENATEMAEARLERNIASVREALGSAKSFAIVEQTRFDAAMNDAVARTDLPDPTDVPCDVTRAAPLAIVAGGDRNFTNPSVTHILADVAHTEELLSARRFDEAIADASALSIRLASAAERPRYDYFVLASEFKSPTRTGPGSYEPGEISGRAYLYDWEKHRVTCAGDIHATSSRRIEYTFVPSMSAAEALSDRARFSSTLDQDLELQVRRAIDHDALGELLPR
jgi:hypothetical protein